jgi:hypothetical protein
LQSAALCANVPIQHEADSVEDICLTGVVLANEARNARQNLKVKVPKISVILNEQTTDIHQATCIPAVTSALFSVPPAEKPKGMILHLRFK